MNHYEVFDDCHMGRGDFYLKEDLETGMRAVIAVSNPELGPALGGVRIARYPNTVAAMVEASRLASTMQYKSAIHQLPYSGGKAVLMAPEAMVDRRPIFRRLVVLLRV